MDMQFELTKLSQFLQTNYHNVVPIPTTEKKEPMYGFKGKTTDALWKSWFKTGMPSIMNGQAQGVSLILRDDWIVIDFDDKEQGELFENGCPEFQQAPKQETSKGCHFYFKRTTECDSNNLFCHIRPFQNIDMDILTKRQEGKEAGLISVYPSPNKKWVRSIFDTPLIDLPDKFIKFYNDKCMTKASKPKVVNDDEDCNDNENNINFEILKEIVDNLADSRADMYPYWSKVVWGIYNESRQNGYRKKGNNLIHEFSARSSKYDEDKVEEFIERARDDTLGVGTLMMMLKEDNEVVHRSIQAKLNPVKKVELNGYSIIEVDEDKVNLRDGCKRNYETMKQIFETTNFKVSGKQTKFVEIKVVDNIVEITERTRKDFLEEYENLVVHTTDKKGEEKTECFAKLWLKDPTIRTYDNIDFIPPPTKATKTTFNTWKGFKAQNINLTIPKQQREELLKPIYDHMKIICNHHEQSFKFLKYWVADMIQRPGKLLGYALCFQSDEGTGKSTFISEFLGKRIIGDLYYWESSNAVQDLFEKHSNAFYNRILVNIDEPKPFDLRNNADRFKSLITNNRQRLEHKNQDSRQVNSCARYVISTNNEDVLKISSNDRRFTIIECSNEKIGDEEYFNNLYEIMDNPEVQRAFYDDLMELDLIGFNWRQERPITSAYIHNLDNCISPIVRFMAGEVMYYENCRITEERVLGSQLYSKFMKLLSKCGSKFSCEYIPFNNKLKKMSGIDKKKTMNGVEFYINISELKEYLAKKEKFDFKNFETYEMIEEYDN